LRVSEQLRTGPLVSILTPSFNQARWLGDNLRSVASQTYPHVEHIVMDGGSTDGSVGLLQEAEDSVAWRSEPDEGQSDALNKAFAASSGEIIGWVNSDDAYFDSDVVRDVVAYFEKHPDADVVYGHAAYVNADGLVLNAMWVPARVDMLIGIHCYIVQPALFLRRGVVEGSLVDVARQFSMDWDLWLRLRDRGARFARLDRILAVDRLQADRKSVSALHLSATDVAIMKDVYGLKLQAWWRAPFMRGFHVFSRIAGLRLLPAAVRPNVFGGRVDGLGRLLLRQIATRRSRMPAEGRPE